MNNIFTVIESLDNAAKVPALKKVLHSSMAKSIGSIRQHIRAEKRATRDERRIALDQANETADLRGDEQIAHAMGFPVQMPPLRQAAIFHAVYVWARDELATVATSRWDQPLSFPDMLDFMTSRAQPLDKGLVEALAAIAKCKPEHILQMHELQDRQDREQLIEMLPEIKATFEGFNHAGSKTNAEYDNDTLGNDALTMLPVLAQHQMGVAVVESLVKAKNQVLLNVMKTRRMTDLGSIALIDEGIEKFKEWVNAFENAFSNDISEALEGGRSLKTLEDVGA